MESQKIPKAYDSKSVEDNIYAAWEASGFFQPKADQPLADNHGDGEPFTIVMPPPNVTGTLHIGHAVMLALEDIMIRFARMRGKKTLWLPGTDHAAIATQAVVEKKLIKEGIDDPRRTLGRDTFLKKVEEFAQASHDRIVEQVKKMGSSCDWSREAYTLDEKRSLAVRTVFKKMYDDGLIYRGNRIVNWCPRCKSTLSDDEVEYKEEKTPFYYFKYGPIVIGTARPETKFQDKTIVVHPDDERYKNLHGKEFEIEWIEGWVRANVIADALIDSSFGTGAMTITPAHSFEDFDLAQKYNLPVVKIIDENGNLTDAAGSFAGRGGRESREEIVEVLKSRGLLDHIDENYLHNLSVCYRCGTPVEPLPKLQWFIDVKKEVRGKSLKDRMREVVADGSIKIIPDRFEKIYLHWIDNLRDWCISRQIWYGHRIPVWYRPSPSSRAESRYNLDEVEGSNQEIFVDIKAPEGDDWIQDEDTLDTWFSSGLWTFSTLGWPEETEDFRTFHPTTVLETGYDIIFFWVARMILMTTYVLDTIPFQTVYLHGLVRDEQGRKMSKSIGNVIDPLTMIEKYGADATRLALVIGTGPGNDTKLSEAKIAGYRNFTNKLWNISRFVISSTSMGEDKGGGDKSTPKTLADEWILSELDQTINEVTKKLENYEFSAAGELLRDFTWNSFADWYIEIAKLQNSETADEEIQKNTQTVLIYCLENILKMWHPFMPFVTENIWRRLGKGRLLMVASWPKTDSEINDGSVRRFHILQEIISSMRNIRADYNVPPIKKLEVTVSAGNDASWLIEESEAIKKLAGLGELEIMAEVERPHGSVTAIIRTIEISVNLSGVIDAKKEGGRINRIIEETKSYIANIENRMSDELFASRAPAHIVEEEKKRHEEAKEKLSKLELQLKNLSNP